MYSRLIGDRYSQGRNLLLFIQAALQKLGLYEETIMCIEAGMAIGRSLDLPSFVEYGESLLTQLKTPSDNE